MTIACLPVRGVGRGCAGALLSSSCGQRAGLLLASHLCSGPVGVQDFWANNSLVFTGLFAIAHVLVTSTGCAFHPYRIISGASTRKLGEGREMGGSRERQLCAGDFIRTCSNLRGSEVGNFLNCLHSRVNIFFFQMETVV